MNEKNSRVGRKTQTNKIQEAHRPPRLHEKLVFVIIYLWNRVWPFIWKNLNYLHPRMLCANLVEIGPVVLEKKMKI